MCGVLACAYAGDAGAAAPTDWRGRSDRIALEYLAGQLDSKPEAASSLGLSEYDGKASRPGMDVDPGRKQRLTRWKVRLEKELRVPGADAAYRTDMAILLRSVIKEQEADRLTAKFGVIWYTPALREVFLQLRTLGDMGAPAERRLAAWVRFKAYVRGQGDAPPYLEGSVRAFRWQEDHFKGRNRFYPLRQQVERDLDDAPKFVEGVRRLLEGSGREDWRGEFEAFAGQAGAYLKFVREHVFPRARKDFRLPPEAYEKILLGRGIAVKPAELARRGRREFAVAREEFRRLAAELAPELGLATRDPLAVLARLKSKRVVSAESAEKSYREAARFIDGRLRARDLVPLPSAPLEIRVAGEAESAAVPVPHLEHPPLLGNRGERPRFVVPSSASGALPLDDFAYEAATYVLVAHEGRPGHELQFSWAAERKVPVARAAFGADDAAVEGWAVYAENLLFDELPKEARLVAMQVRLWRIARMFLDPELQLGRITPRDAAEFLVRELGLSPAMAELEVRRFVADEPGQAPAYHYGFSKLLGIRKRFARVAGAGAGPGADAGGRCFHQAFLFAGPVPLDLLEKEILAGPSCPAAGG